ncbi:MAG TPA: enoyl-ACP reductase [Phycisphaerae bacterium]|jgi:enoyl-[acyl-carrier protein] reductase I|nr:enoyl-ACP reductase [Phycisphaerae bacterium]
MALLTGKKAFIFGVLNEYSIGYHIAQKLHDEGCELAFSHLPAEKIERRVVKAVEKFGPKFLAPCDVSKDEDLDSAFKKAAENFGTFDILVHSLAFAPAEALHNPFLQTTREQFRTALDISAYSLVAMARLAQPLMNKDGSIITLSYLGAEKFIPMYNVMAVAKAALECSVRYLAAEMGRHEKNIRVNAISAGAIKTMAARGIGDIDRMMVHYTEKAPLPWDGDTAAEHVGKTGLWLASNLSTGVTGETIYVDGGYSIVGW